MPEQNMNSPRDAQLRNRAEEIVRAMEAKNAEKLTAEDVQHMLHELRVHQVELEMQNEELRRVQAELETSRARYVDLYDFAPVGYITVGESGMITEANLTAAGLVGLTRGELIKQPLSHFIVREAQDAYYLCRKNLFSTGTPQICPLQLKKKNGISFWVQLEMILVPDAEGMPTSRIIISDMTWQKQAEELKKKMEDHLYHVQKMEAIGKLAGGMAHNFNNLLSVILGNVSLLLMKLNPKDSIYDDILDIKIAGEHSANLIRQLLTFARRQPNVPKVIDIQAAISRCLTLLRPMIDENIQLHWVPTASAWPIKIDPVQIEQILTNLMVNARDAISDKGSITIHSENMEIDEDFCKTNAGFVCGKYIHLSVRDDGCGMDTATQKQIFEPFFTTKELGKGTGLGLATVYGIVLQNNGFITLSSELGKGTTFHIYLPRYEASIMDIQKQDIVPSIDTEVILVAEDNDALLKVVTNMLKKLGYTVLPANNPNEAIKICRECPGDIHMLLTDVIMPGMDGKELYQHIIAMRPTLKGLFMSGYTADVIAQWGVLDEGIHFLQKPFNMEELSRKVREALLAQQ